MATTVTVTGSNYSVPATADENWGTQVSNLLIALATSTKVLQSSGGVFTLTGEVNLGATYGLKLPYIKSQATNPASSGIVRLGNTEAVSWRNAANSGNLDLAVTSSNELSYNGVVLINSSGSFLDSTFRIGDGSDATKKIALEASGISTATTRTITMPDADVNLGSLVNANISASAAIAQSKLSLSITNSEVNASAAIALSKLAALSNSIVPVTNGSGILTSSAVTATELGYLTGVTAAIQTALDAKQLRSTLTTKGDIYAATASNIVTRLGVGTNGQTLQADSTQATGLKWASPATIAIGDTITSATAGSVFFGGTSGILQQDNSNLFWDDSNNRLGIGNNSLSDFLNIGSGSSSGDVLARFKNNGIGSTGTFVGIESTTGNMKLGTSDTRDIKFFANNTEFMKLEYANGYLGLGQSTPTAKVHIKVAGAVAPGTAAIKIEDSAALSTTFAGINFLSTGNNGSSRINGFVDSGGATGGMMFLTGGATPTEAMRVNSNGTLGVGTSGSGADASQVYVASTSSGTETVGLNLINGGTGTSTAIAIKFTPNSSAALAKIAAFRTNSPGGGATDLRFYNHNGTSVGETMRVEGDGSFQVGTVTTTARTHWIYNNSTANTTLVVRNQDTSTGSDDNYALECVKGSTTNTAGTNRFILFSINATGTGSGYIGSNGANAAAFFSTSDRRAKEDFQTLSGLETVLQLNPVSFKWKEDKSVGRGFIAQEVAEILPHLVNKTDDGQGESTENPWSMTDSGMVPYLVAAIKELKAELDQLKAQIQNS